MPQVALPPLRSKRNYPIFLSVPFRTFLRYPLLPFQSLSRAHMLSLKDVHNLSVRASSTPSKATAKAGLRRNSKPRPNPDEKPNGKSDSNRTLETKQTVPPPGKQAGPPKHVSGLPVPKPEGQQEVRWILKKRNSSLQSSSGSRTNSKRASEASTHDGDCGGLECRAPSAQGRPGTVNNASSYKIVAPPPSPLSNADRRATVEGASSFCEQFGFSSLVVGTLTFFIFSVPFHGMLAYSFFLPV